MSVFFPEALLDRVIDEDLSYGDLTTELLHIGPQKGRMIFSTREPTVICCTEEAGRIFEKLGAKVVHLLPSGNFLPACVDFLEVAGTAEELHGGWRICLSLLEHISGIATRTRNIVKNAKAVNPTVSIETSRKSFPGGKKMAIKAVLCGGAQPHRLGLSESVLIFKHHRVFSENAQSFWADVQQLRHKVPGKKLTVEIETVEEALMAAKAGVDIIQVDKMPCTELKELISKVRGVSPTIKIAAAGGITETNAGDYAATGAEILVLSSVYSGRTSDIGACMFPA